MAARPIAAIAVGVATIVAVLRIEVGAMVTGGFLLTELTALVALAELGATHAPAPRSPSWPADSST